MQAPINTQYYNTIPVSNSSIIQNYVYVSSIERNTTSYPDPNHYRIDFKKIYKNISAIRLIYGVLANVNNLTGEPYLLMTIDEVNENVDTNINSFIDNAYTMLLFPHNTDDFVNLLFSPNNYVEKRYLTPLASLKSLTLTLSDYSGVPFNFGADTIPPTKLLQNGFLFIIETLNSNERETKTL